MDVYFFCQKIIILENTKNKMSENCEENTGTSHLFGRLSSKEEGLKIFDIFLTPFFRRARTSVQNVTPYMIFSNDELHIILKRRNL